MYLCMYVCTYVYSELKLCIYINIGTFLDLHDLGPTIDTVNPVYHIVTNSHYKETKLAEEPNSYYEEVNKPPEVKMTLDPAYSAP